MHFVHIICIVALLIRLYIYILLLLNKKTIYL